MNLERYNKQLADYTARAIEELPKGELIDRIESSNNLSFHATLGAMTVDIHTVVLEPNDRNVTRRHYSMTACGLGVVSEEITL